MKKNLHYLGIVMCLLGIGFVCIKLISNMATVLNFLPQDINTWCMFCFLCLAYAVVLNLLAWGWRNQLRFNSKVNLPFKDTLSIYAQSQIAKYIPGNVFQYIGRNMLASRYQLDGVVVLKSSFYEIASLLMSALLLIAIMMIFAPSPLFLNTLEFIKIPNWLGLVGVLIVIVIALLGKHLKWIAKVKHFISDYFVPYFWFTFTFHLISVLIFIGLWLGVMHQPFSLDTILILGYAYLFSWVIGFVTPGSPGGLGVREALFIFLASIPTLESQIIFLMICSRLLNTLGDFLFFLQGLGFSRNRIVTA